MLTNSSFWVLCHEAPLSVMYCTLITINIYNPKTNTLKKDAIILPDDIYGNTYNGIQIATDEAYYMMVECMMQIMQMTGLCPLCMMTGTSGTH